MIETALYLSFISMLGVGIAYLAPFAVNHAAKENLDMDMGKIYISAMIGGWAGALSLGYGDLLFSYAFGMLGIVMMVLAMVDRETSWAPDVLIIPFCLLASFVAHEAPRDPALWPHVLFYAAGFYIFPQLLFWAIIRSKGRLMPPPDMIAILSPFLVFGLSEYTALSYIIITIVLIAIRQFEYIRGYIFKNGVSEDILEKEENAITFLTVSFPFVFYVALLKVVLGGAP